MPIFTCKAPGKPTITLAAEDAIEAAYEYAQSKLVTAPLPALVRVAEFITGHSAFIEVRTADAAE